MNPLDKLARLVGVPGYEHRPESQAMEDRDEVRADFQAGFLRRTTQEWLDTLLAEDVWCAPVNDFAAVEHDPQIAENEMIVSWEHPTADTVRSTGVAVKFDETPGDIARPAPLLGQHTEELLRQYGGYSDDEIAGLIASGVVHRGAAREPR
jgi:crotonobetainyl-CoA:carnitine CoA-transferase CaiB-like acyl-CoA transferase